MTTPRLVLALAIFAVVATANGQWLAAGEEDLPTLTNGQDDEDPLLQPALFAAGLDEQEREILDGRKEMDEEEGNIDVVALSETVGEIGGLALDDVRKRLLLFQRGPRVWDRRAFPNEPTSHRVNASWKPIAEPTLWVVDPESGKVLEKHGAGLFYLPHGLTIDKNGSIWVTDVGAHQVFKLDSAFKVVMRLGEPLTSGSDNSHFCKPTDVAVASNGHFFVADGYCNRRILKFDEKGNLLAEIRTTEEGDLRVPHSLALIEDLDLICVADRENERVLCLSAGLGGVGRRALPAGMVITRAEQVGRVFAIRERAHVLVGLTKDEEDETTSQLFAFDLQTGQARTLPQSLGDGHALALSDSGDVYVAQMRPSQVLKLAIQQDAE